jgi:transcriptional regulator with XRE-family HTH domain
MAANCVHHGHNIKRLREIQGIKQEVLARALGTGWSQKKVSLLEGKKIIEHGLLAQVALALGLPVRAIDDFNENVLSESLALPHNHQAIKEQLATLEKMMELLQENRTLYQRLLQAEEEKRVLREQLCVLSSEQPVPLRLVNGQ